MLEAEPTRCRRCFCLPRYSKMDKARLAGWEAQWQSWVRWDGPTGPQHRTLAGPREQAEVGGAVCGH